MERYYKTIVTKLSLLIEPLNSEIGISIQVEHAQLVGAQAALGGLSPPLFVKGGWEGLIHWIAWLRVYQ